MEIVEFQGKDVKVNDLTFAIPEFRVIGDRRDSKKAFTVIYFCGDYRSPYVNAYGLENCKSFVSKDLGIEIDSDIEKAIEKYRSLKETPTMRLLNAAIECVYKLEQYFRDVDFTKKDGNGKLLYDPGDVIKSIKDISAAVESLTKTKELVEKEIVAGSKVRGGGEIGRREVPRK